MSFLGIDANKSGKDADWIEKIIFFNIYYCTNRICIKIIRKVRVQTIHLKTSSLHDLTPANLSVIVAPHPDDEVFGCCGLMQRLIAQGKRVELIIMTGGGKSHAGCCDIDESELIRQRRQLTIRAAKEYGLSQEYIHFLDYPDGGVLESDSQTDKLSSLIHKIVDGQNDVSVFYPHKMEKVGRIM